MVVGAYSMRSGDVGDNEQSWLQVSADGPGAVTFYYQVFGERTCDGELVPVNWDNLYFEVDGYLVLDDATEDPVWWGMDFTNVAFPAALTSVVAIGASTIDGFRATYSCFGTNSEVLTASGGSAGEDPLRTTDRRGADGYSPTDYYDGFSGTSPSAALAAGIAGLLFSANPHLTPFQARELLRQSARKIGTIPYTDGFNPRYGYGQADAAAAMRLMLSNMPPEMTGMETMSNQVRFALVGIESNRLYDVYGASALAPGTQDWHKLNVTNLYGHPVFGVNETPFFDRGPTLRVFRVVK
jgi:subtilisin family serine protease